MLKYFLSCQLFSMRSEGKHAFGSHSCTTLSDHWKNWCAAILPVLIIHIVCTWISMLLLHPVAHFLCVAASYIDPFVIRLLFFFFPAAANQGDVSLGRRHRSNKQLSLLFTLPAILWAHSTIWLPVQQTGEKKKSIAGINVAWAHRRLGYYTCKKLLEAALVSSLVLCTWWSWYDRWWRQLCYTACNEFLSMYVCLRYISKS